MNDQLETQTTPAAELPLCQYGPGGSYVYTVPATAPPIATAPLPAPIHTQLQRVKELGLEIPLICNGPQGLRLEEKTAQPLVRGFVEDLLRNVRSGQRNIGRVFRAVETKVLARKIACVDFGPALAIQQAMMAACPRKLTPQPQLQENAHANRHTTSTGNPTIHSGLSAGEWLFPNDAGNRRSAGADQGHRVRARRRTGKKVARAARSQAQGSLFASV